MSRTTQVLCLMLLLAYQGAYATKTDIQVIQPFPSFISVQENHSKDFDMSDYFAGFNLTFSLLPNKITESANVAPKTISAYKAVVPITRGPAFNRSHVIATYAALKEDNTLRIIDTTMEDHFYGDVMFWEVKLPVLEQDTCFDVSNALNNIIWVDCQNSTHNFILLLEFSSAQVYNTKQIIVTERVSDIDSSPLKRQLSFSDANASSEVQSVYRFIAKADGKFMIEEFVYINAMGRVQAGPVRTAANYTKLKDFTPRSLIAFKNFVMLVGKSKEVALGSVSEDNFKIQTLFNDDAEIESAQAHMLTGSFYFLLFSHAGKLTGFYLSGPSKTVLSNNITFPAVDTESYISHTVIDGFIAALSRKKGSGNSLLTMYADTDAKEIDVYYHNELQHKVGQSESGWIFPVGGNYLVAVTKDSVEVFLHYPQILSVDHRLAWDLIDFGELEVKSTYYDQVLTREFDMELHYYRENDTSIGERKDSIKYVNLMYPDYFRVPIWQYAYGPALRLDLQTKFPHTLVKDQDKVNVSLSDKAPNLAKALNGSLTFVEFKTVDMNGDLEYYLLVQNKEYFYTAICDLDHQYNLTTQNLNCSDLAEPFQIEGEVSTVLTDHPNFNLVEETIMYPNTHQLLKVYTKDFKYLIKTITIEEDDDSDLSNFCSELLYDASTHEYLCVKRFQGEVLKLNFTGTTPHDSNVAESVFNAENCSLKSIHKIRLSAYYPNYYFIQTEHKVAIIEKKKLFEVGSFDFSSNLTTTNFEYFIMLDKIVAISYEDQKIIEIFFAKKDFKHEETRSVALFGYHIDLSHKLWDTLNSDGNFYFQGKNAYGERALLVYDFSLDPNHHPLRAIIPLEKPKSDYGYYLRIAQGDSFSIALVMDSQQAEKYSFKLVYTLPVVYVTTNQTGYNADEFEKPYDVKLIVSSPLTRQKIDLSFTLFLTVTQRTITVKPNANITQLNNPPAKGKYCAPFNAHDIFEGTVFSVNISNSAQGIDYSPRVTASFPTYQEINKIFTTSITHIRKITMGHKYIHLVSVKELYKFTVEPGLPAGFNQGKEIITLPDDGYSHYWDQLVVSSDESHVVLGAPFYNGSFFLLKVTGKETKSAVLQDSNTVLLAISSDNMLFAVSSPNYYNFSSSDAFISYFDLTDMSKLGEFSIASVIAKNALNFNKSEILAFDVYSQNAHSTDLVILDKSQGLIICHLDLFKTQLACEAINITIYVEGDMPGVTPIWKFMKLVKTTQDGSDTIFKVLVSARNYHSYLFSITKSENLSLNIRVEKGFMHYYQYSDTSFMTANEKFFVALTTIPNTNVHKETSEYLYFYDLVSANSSTNINWRQYPLIDAFQREKVGDSKVDITMAMGMSAAIDTVFTASYFNGYFNMYKVGTEHQLCVAKAEDVDSKTSFRITATNDYSKAYMDYNLGKKWDEADPDGTGPRATSGGKFWYVMMWIAIFLGVVAGVYFVAKKLKERKGIVRLEGQLNDPVYQEL